MKKEKRKKTENQMKKNDHPGPPPPHRQIRAAPAPRESPSLLSANAGAMVLFPSGLCAKLFVASVSCRAFRSLVMVGFSRGSF